MRLRKTRKPAHLALTCFSCCRRGMGSRSCGVRILGSCCMLRHMGHHNDQTARPHGSSSCSNGPITALPLVHRCRRHGQQHAKVIQIDRPAGRVHQGAHRPHGCVPA
jgi:hypothetical protein